MKKISAEEFIEDWFKFSATLTSEVDWEENLQSNSKWSKYVLGTKSSRSDCSPIGEYFKLKNKMLRYRTEDGLFDLGMSLHQNVDKIATVNKYYESAFYNLKENNFYPTIYDVVLEHENNLYTSWQEIVNLSWVRSFLKVLVTYYSERTNEAQRKKENEIVQENFRSIIGGCCHEFPDNEQTEYVLLMGWKEDHNLKWTSNIFDAGGNFKNLLL